MRWFQGLFFLVLGVGLLGVVWQSLRRGWLPCGPNGLKGTLKFHRDAQPGAYWLMFSLYGAGGLWLLVFSLRLLSGNAEPLPLR